MRIALYRYLHHLKGGNISILHLISSILNISLIDLARHTYKISYLHIGLCKPGWLQILEVSGVFGSEYPDIVSDVSCDTMYRIMFRHHEILAGIGYPFLFTRIRQQQCISMGHLPLRHFPKDKKRYRSYRWPTLAGEGGAYNVKARCVARIFAHRSALSGNTAMSSEHTKSG